MYNSKLLLVSILALMNSIFMFVSFTAYHSSGKYEAEGAALSAFTAWAWVSILLFKKSKEGKKSELKAKKKPEE